MFFIETRLAAEDDQIVLLAKHLAAMNSPSWSANEVWSSGEQK